MSDLETRLYKDEDFDDVWRLFHRLYEYYETGDLHTEEETKRYVRDVVLGPDSDVTIAVILSDGVIVGLATYSILHPAPGCRGQLFLKDLFVDASQRKSGAGRAMMRFLANQAIAHGCDRLDWTAETSNPNALAFYDAIGAKRETEKVYFRLSGGKLASFADDSK